MAKVSTLGAIEREPIKVTPAKPVQTPKAEPVNTDAQRQQAKQNNAAQAAKVQRAQANRVKSQQAEQRRQQAKQDNAALVARTQASIRDRQQMEQSIQDWRKTDAGRQQAKQNNAAILGAQQRRNALVSAYGDTSGKSALDIFRETEGGTGGHYSSRGMDETRQKLYEFQTGTLNPLLADYNKLLESYNSGEATRAQLENAYNKYMTAYYQYTPMYEAWETMRQGGILEGLREADSKSLSGSAERWYAAGEAASATLDNSYKNVQAAADAYAAAFADLGDDPDESKIQHLNELVSAYEEALGKYNADLFVAQEIGEISGLLGRRYNKAVGREREQFYADNPYVLRPDDTAESIAERTATLKADYEAAESAMQEAGRKYTADSDAEAFGLGAGYSDAAKAAYDSAREAYDVARLNYERMQSLDDWASDPAHLESRSEWERNGWTWDQRFFLYQQTGDKKVLDDLVYGYGNFVATPEQRQQLTDVLEQEFKDAKADRYVDLPEFQSVRTADPEIEKAYREAQARMHQMGQKATDVNDVTEAIAFTVASDFASLGALAFDAVSAATRAIGGKTEFLDWVSSNIKAERAMAQEAMARETTGMPYAESMAIQLTPSIVECLFSMIGAEALLVGSAPAGATTSGLTQAARLSQSMTKTEEFLRIGSMTMQDMARNPQYWTSFARVAGTDYVDALNEGASQSQAMMYALVDGSINALIEIGGGGIQNLPYTMETLESPTLRKALSAALQSSYEEGMEEVYQGIVERGISAVLLSQNREIASLDNKEAIFSFAAALEEFIGGAAVSTIVGLPRAAGKIREGAERDNYIKDLNRVNMQLPEDMRLPAIDPDTATDLDIEDYENAVNLRIAVVQATNQATAKRSVAEAGMSEEEILQSRIEAANPDKAVLDTMASKIQDNGYGDAVKAQEQADLIRKTLEGEMLTSEEAARLDLNNPAVRAVFIERTGLTGLPTDTKLSREAIRAYAEAATRTAQEAQSSLKEMQKAIAERNAETAKAAPVKAAPTNDATADTKAQTDAPAKGNSSKGLDLLKRKLNKEIRRARGKTAQEAAITENKRHRDIRTEGRTLEQVFEGVQRQSGIDSIMTYEEFRKSDMVRSTSTGTDESNEALNSLDILGQYYSYLTGMGLTRAEADAIMRVQPLTKAESSAYTEKKTVKEDVKDDGGKTADDGGDTGRAGSGGGLVLAERDGQRDGDNDESSGESSDSGLGQPGGGSTVPPGSDAAGPDVSEKSSGEAEPERLTDEIRKAIGEKYKEARIENWSDASVSQLSEKEASSFTQLMDLVRRATGADVYLLNTQGLGVALEPTEGARAAGEFVTINGRPTILIAADLAVSEYSPTRTLAHECIHALFKKNGRGATRGKLRMKIMTDMTLLKAYNAFKSSPMGKAYVKAAKGDENVVCEEYASKVLAHQYGTEAEQKAIEKFVEDNAPDFPVAAYIRKVKALDELYAAPKTVDQFVEKKPGAPDGETPPLQDSKRPPAPKKASTQARVLAEQNGIDLSEITGSGKKGMVRVADVRAEIEKRAEIEAAKAEAAKAETPKAETQKAEAPKAETPTPVSPAKTEAPKPEAPKPEAPKTVKPTTVSPAKAETPKADTPKMSGPEYARSTLEKFLKEVKKDSTIRRLVDAVLEDENLAEQMRTNPAKLEAALMVCDTAAMEADADVTRADWNIWGPLSTEAQREDHALRYLYQNGIQPTFSARSMYGPRNEMYRERHGEFEVRERDGTMVPYEAVVDEFGHGVTARRKDGKGEPVTAYGHTDFEMWESLLYQLGDTSNRPLTQPPWPKRSWSVTAKNALGEPEKYILTVYYDKKAGFIKRVSDGHTATVLVDKLVSLSEVEYEMEELFRIGETDYNIQKEYESLEKEYGKKAKQWKSLETDSRLGAVEATMTKEEVERHLLKSKSPIRVQIKNQYGGEYVYYLSRFNGSDLDGLVPGKSFSPDEYVRIIRGELPDNDTHWAPIPVRTTLTGSTVEDVVRDAVDFVFEDKGRDELYTQRVMERVLEDARQRRRDIREEIARTFEKLDRSAAEYDSSKAKESTKPKEAEPEAPKEETPKAETPKEEKPIRVAPAKTEAPKTAAPKTEAPKTEAPKTEAPKTETPKTEAPKVSAPARVAPAKTETPKPEAPKVSAPVRVATAKTETPKTETPKTEAPKTAAPKTEAPKTEAPKTEAPKTETPKSEAPKPTAVRPAKTETPKTEAPKTEAPKPTTVVPAETLTPVEGAPEGLSLAQQSRIPKALAGLSGKSVGAVYQTLIDTLLPGGESARYVGNDGAFNRAGGLKESLQNLLLAFDKADILYVQGRGLAKRNNQFLNNGSTDVRLRRGYSMVSIDPATKAELRGTPGLLPSDRRITQKTVAEAQQRMIYFRTAQAIFDQMAYSRATSEWINRGRKGNSDQGAILAEIYDQLGKRGGLKPTDIAALRRRAYDLYYDKAVEYGLIHDNYRTITTTTTDMVGDRLADLRRRVALASVREKAARLKTEISGEQFTEMLKAEQAAIDKMDSIKDLAEKLNKKNYLSGEDVSDIISAEAQQKSYAIAGAAETERIYQYEEQASTSERGDEPTRLEKMVDPLAGDAPAATIFNQAAEDSMMQGFRRWAEYQMMRDIFAYSRLMKALGKNTADTYKGTDFDLIARAVLPGLNATLSPENIYSKRTASDIMRTDTTVQSIQNETTGTMREWATNNFWTSEPSFGREGKRTDLVEKYLEELFETAKGHAEAFATAKEDLAAAQNEARQLARVLRDYNRAGDLGVDPTIGPAEAVIEAESKAKEETAERISRQTQGRGAPEDEANLIDQVEEEADRGVYESGRDEDEGASDEYEGLRATEDPTIDASLSESDAEELGGSYTMDDDLSLQQESYQFDPLYKAIVEEELRNRGVTSKEDADPRLVSEALWEAGIRYERRTGSVDPDAYLDDPRFAATLKNVLEQREIPPEPKVGTAAQVKWEEKYGYKYKKAFNDAVTKYRDETRGEGPRKMYGEPIRQRLVETNFRIKELRKTVANRESRAKFYAKNAENYKTVPGGASLYLLQNLTERVGLGAMTPEQAMNATRAARLLWAKDNTITADQILGLRSGMFSADPARQVDELLKAARRVDLNEIGDKLYRDAVNRAIANNKKGYKGTTATYDDVEVLHDLVADSDTVAEESETARVNRRAEVVKALDEAGKIEANDANNIRADVVRDLRAEGATELTAPVGYTEKTRQHKVTPDTLAREAEEAKSGKPIRVPVRDTSSVNKRYGLDDINVGKPYSKKRRKLNLSKTPKEILHTIDRLGFNDCEAVSRAGMKQTRLDNLNNHITLVRGASATANAILTDALVDPNGNVIGSSFADVFLCRDKIHPRQIDRDAQNTLEKYFLLNMTIDRMSAEARADRAVEDYEALYPEVRKLTPDQIKQYRNSNPIIGKYAQLLLWQRGAKNKPVLAVNDTFDDGTPIPLSAEDAQRMLNQLQSENPWLQAKADAFYDWWDLFMRTYVVGGAVSEQDYDNIRNAAPHYVPTHREGSTGAFVKEYAEMISSFTKTMNVGAALKPAKGSTKRIEPIADQLASLIGTYVKSYRSRMLVNNFFDELLVDDDGNFAEFGRIVWSKTDPIFQQAHAADSDDAGAAVGKVDGEDGGYYLATWRDGKKIVAHISEGMYHSMNNLIGKGYQKVQKLMDFFNATTTPMKMAITGVNAFFSVRNVTRDVPTAFVNTENKSLSYGRGWLEACAHIAQNSDLWRVYCALGGEHANINYRKKGLVNAIDDPKAVKRVVKGTINVLSVVGETSESVTRFAEFLATIRRMGDTPTTRMIAMHRAAEVTVDFSRAGWAARFANSWQPYFNPAIQGIAKVFRSVFESKTPGKTIGFNGKTAVKGLLWAILPEILFGLWRKAKNKEKEFNELSDYVKDNYYMIPAGGHDWIRIAKTREWAAVFGNAVMRLMEGSTGYERPFETYWDISIKGNFLPEVPVGLLIQLGWQLGRNENYAGSVIIPKTFDEFKDTHPMDVYDEDTSAVAYLIASITSKVFAELNPMAWDYILNYYFGDFYSQIWEGLTWMNVQRWVDGEYGFWDLTEDSFQMLLENTKQVFVTDDRYSNSTVTRYYDMYSQLRSDVASAKYKNGGATGSLDEAVLAALSDQRYGYSAMIQKLAKEARSLPNGEEKDQIKGKIVVLAGLAQDFYNRCMSGEITDPERYIKYSVLGGEVCNELIWLGEPDAGYNPEDIDFDPTFSCPAYLRDPNNPNKQFKITGDEGLRTEFISAYEANFAEAATALVRSSRYQSLSKTAKAAAMQQQESYALAQTKSEFAELLKKRGIRSESKTITSVELAKVEAEYVLQGINNPNLAIDDDVVGELVALDNYTSKYSFVLSTSVPATFRSQNDSDYVYNLNSRQQTYYATTRAALYNDAMISVITSERYGEAKPQERAAMLEVACGYVDKELKDKMQKLLDRENAKPTLRVSTSEELLDEEAKYSVARILSPDDAYDTEVTDELLRLYGLSDEYSFQPPTTKPVSYVDPEDRDKEYILTEEQREKYVEISHATYNDAVLTIITDPSYARLTDAQKAERLNAMRSKLAEVVRNEFLLWLSQNTTSTDREDPKVSKETAAYVKKLLGW